MHFNILSRLIVIPSGSERVLDFEQIPSTRQSLTYLQYREWFSRSCIQINFCDFWLPVLYVFQIVGLSPWMQMLCSGVCGVPAVCPFSPCAPSSRCFSDGGCRCPARSQSRNIKDWCLSPVVILWLTQHKGCLCYFAFHYLGAQLTRCTGIAMSTVGC